MAHATPSTHTRHAAHLSTYWVCWGDMQRPSSRKLRVLDRYRRYRSHRWAPQPVYTTARRASRTIAYDAVYDLLTPSQAPDITAIAYPTLPTRLSSHHQPPHAPPCRRPELPLARPQPPLQPSGSPSWHRTPLPTPTSNEAGSPTPARPLSRLSSIRSSRHHPVTSTVTISHGMGAPLTGGYTVRRTHNATQRSARTGSTWPDISPHGQHTRRIGARWQHTGSGTKRASWMSLLLDGSGSPS